MHQNAFGDRVPPWPAGGVQALPRRLATAKGKGTEKWKGREEQENVREENGRKGKKEGEGKYKGGFASVN